MKYETDKDGVIVLRIDPRKGKTGSNTGKMDLLNDAPRGWTDLDKSTGLALSINIGYRK